ncbi:membrane associated DnaJ chaperone [Trichophyton equinum CBS 127.97]|uniref:Membrane associated DnaJ chaperone n=1 Tax=Trichophyton equinum (strain ATCC MYA-4606 / CBS 127.97) TaxID=559882 RepID=F2PTN8_TRIEC|nr:membrane associated DnaJ chaperone [Trichophyton equinum CBS 127.97]
MDAASRVSLCCWAFLPGIATSFLQSLYYHITISAGTPHPQPGSARHARHRQRIHVAVISSYLLYTIYEEYHTLRLAPDFYQILGVLPTSDERTIKSRFRRMATVFHPDKARQYGLGSNAEDAATVDEFFVLLKLAQDTLLDPVKRFAYDRFGAKVVIRPGEPNKTLSMATYFYEGLYALAPQYLVGFLLMVLLNTFWFSAWGRYWRFYTFFALLTLELTLLTHPNATFMPGAYLPAMLSSLLGLDRFYLLPFQILSLARTASMSMNVFISQLAPPDAKLQASQSKERGGEEGLSVQAQKQLTQIVQLAQAQDAESAKLLGMDMLPFRGNVDRAGRLRRGMKERLRREEAGQAPEVQQAIAAAKHRRQQGQNEHQRHQEEEEEEEEEE